MRIRSSIQTTLAGFLILTLGTIIAVVWVEPYRQVGGELLRNPDFATGLTGWEQPVSENVVHQGPVLRLHLDDNTGDARIEQRIGNPERFHRLRLSADIKSHGVVPGEKAWHRARLILSSYDKNGNWLAVPHGVAGIEGTNDWQHVERVFTVSRMAAELKVMAVLYRASGTVWFKNLRLTEVRKGPAWQVTQVAAICLWSLFLASIMLPLILKSKSALSKASLVVLVAAILAGTLVPADVKELLQAGSTAVFSTGDPKNKIVPKNPSTADAFAEKNEASARGRQRSNSAWKIINNAGHLFLFFLLAALLGRIYPVKIPYLLFPIILLAGATELMQFFVDGRGPGIEDWLLDIGGALIGITLVSQRCHLDKQSRKPLST